MPNNHIPKRSISHQLCSVASHMGIMQVYRKVGDTDMLN